MLKTIETFISKIAENDKDSCFIYVDGLILDSLLEVEKKYPNRVIRGGISEQNVISMATGMALTGKTVYVFMLSAYATRRALDQLTFAGYCQADIKVIAYLASLSVPYAGFSHTNIDDVSNCINIPNLEIFNPCSVAEIKSVMEGMHKSKKPSILFFDNRGCPAPDCYIKYGYITKMENGLSSNCCIITSGFACSFLYDAWSILHKLRNNGVDPSVYTIHRLKPINEEEILNILKKYKKVVTFEIRGKGAISSIISEILSKNNISAKLLPIYIKDEKFDVMGECVYVAAKYLRLNETIKEIVKFIQCNRLLKFKYREKNGIGVLKTKLFGLTVYKKIKKVS